MVGGASEPLYTPCCDSREGRLYYREDFRASALHEAAHWCVAGKDRRQKEDFGYDYEPPPRSRAQQSAFYLAEAKVQALEKLFSAAASIAFTPSTDDPELNPDDFREKIDALVPGMAAWMIFSPDCRARRFFGVLQREVTSG